MIDILKPYAYMYDATIDKLYKLLESNLGKLTVFDTASIPDSWKVEQWLHFAKVNHLAVKNSFNEGKKGAATGKVYGAMNNNTTGTLQISIGTRNPPPLYAPLILAFLKENTFGFSIRFHTAEEDISIVN